MKSRHLVQVTSIQNACVFCVHRFLSNGFNFTANTRFRAYNRRISTSENRTSTATGTAIREEAEDDQNTHNWAKWGAFSGSDSKPLLESSTSERSLETNDNGWEKQKIDALRARMSTSTATNRREEHGTTEGLPELTSREDQQSQTVNRFSNYSPTTPGGTFHISRHTFRDQASPTHSKKFRPYPVLNQNEALPRKFHVSDSLRGPQEADSTRDETRKISRDRVTVTDNYSSNEIEATKIGSQAASNRNTVPFLGGQQTNHDRRIEGFTSQWSSLRRRNQEPHVQQPQGDSKESVYEVRQANKDRSNTGMLRNSFETTNDVRSPHYVPFRRVDGMACFQCGQLGHLKVECPTLNAPKALRGGETVKKETYFDRKLSFDKGTKQPSELEVRRMSEYSVPEQSPQASLSDLFPIKPSISNAESITSTVSTRLAAEAVGVNFQDRDRKQRRPRFARRPTLDDDDDVDEDRLQARRERKRLRKLAQEHQPIPIFLPPFISVINLATALKVRSEEFVEKLHELGFEDVQLEHVMNAEDAGLIATEYGFEPVVDKTIEEEDLKPRPQVHDTSLPNRPPIVTIMGHVDHGKTTIIDYLRKSSVAASEHGGITQHIGAFSVEMSSGRAITFLDTPGHAAFLSMRERGANVTDIVVLVVAADDSVKPQTLEAIKHAKAAQVPIIVAINKIDKHDADPTKVRQDLARHGIEVEDYGGDVQAVEVSGKTGQGMNELEEAIALQAEVLDLRAETDGAAEGWIIEATKDKVGRRATVLVKRGTLRPGNVIVAGKAWARVRTLSNHAGDVILEAPPGTPVAVDGWREQPVAGDEVLQAPSEKRASAVVALRCTRSEHLKLEADLGVINKQRTQIEERKQREKEAASATTTQELVDESTGLTQPKIVASGAEVARIGKSYSPVLYFVLKADVTGSLEAVQGSILSIPLQNQPLRISILATGVGPINESDVAHAAAAPKGTAHIIAFNVASRSEVTQLAEQSGVRLLEHSIIYRLVDDVRNLVEVNLPPIVTKRVKGEAEVLKVFDIGIGGRKTMQIAGCTVRNGIMSKGGRVRVFKGSNVGDETSLLYDGNIASLKNVKKEVSEMRKGTECGIAFEDWQGFEIGDQMQCYEEQIQPRKLS